MKITHRQRVVLALVLPFIGVGLSADARGQSTERRLVEAARRADSDAVRAQIEEGADVDHQTGDGSTALLWRATRTIWRAPTCSFAPAPT